MMCLICPNCNVEMHEIIIKGELISETTNGVYQVTIADPGTADVLCSNCGYTDQIEIEVIDG